MKLQDQVRNLICNRRHLFDFAPLFQIDKWADVHTADGAMAVISGISVVAGENLSKPLDEFRQPGRIHGGVFNKSDRLLVALGAKEQTETGLSNSPDGLNLLRLESQSGGIAYCVSLEQLFEFINLFFHRFFG